MVYTYRPNVMHLHLDVYFIAFILFAFIANIIWLKIFANRHVGIAYMGIWGLVGLIVSTTFFYDTITALSNSQIIKALLILASALPFALFIHFYDKEGQKTALFILAFIVFNSVSAVMAKIEYKNIQQKVGNFYTGLTVDDNFTKKHNVYYLVMDTYPSAQKLSVVDNFDNSEIYDFLKDNKFYVQNSAVSNWNWSVPSMNATFNMQFDPTKMGEYYNIALKRVVVWGGKNKVAKTFSENGYGVYIRTLEDDIYKRGDEAYKMDIDASKAFMIITKMQPVAEKIFKKLGLTKEISPPYFYEILKNAPKTQSPKFTYLHSYVVHRDFYECLKFKGVDWNDMSNYYKQIKCANKDIKKTVDHINTIDPNAIIIFQADHGQTVYGHAPNQDMYLWRAKRQGALLSGDIKDQQRTAVLSEYGILLAVKWPEDCAYLGTETYTPVNLFPRVFACLSDKKPDYSKMSPNVSYRLGYDDNGKEHVLKVIDDYKILDKPEVIYEQ